MSETTTAPKQEATLVANTRLSIRSVKEIINPTTIRLSNNAIAKKAEALVVAVGNFVTFTEQVVNQAYQRNAAGEIMKDENGNPLFVSITPRIGYRVVSVNATEQEALNALTTMQAEESTMDFKAKAAVVKGKQQAEKTLSAIYSELGYNSMDELMRATI